MPTRRLTSAERTAIRDWCRDNYFGARKAGRTHRDAWSLAKKATKDKYRAIPWALILPILLELLPLLIELWKKR